MEILREEIDKQRELDSLKAERTALEAEGEVPEDVLQDFATRREQIEEESRERIKNIRIASQNELDALAEKEAEDEKKRKEDALKAEADAQKKRQDQAKNSLDENVSLLEEEAKRKIELLELEGQKRIALGEDDLAVEREIERRREEIIRQSIENIKIALASLDEAENGRLLRKEQRLEIEKDLEEQKRQLEIELAQQEIDALNRESDARRKDLDERRKQ